MLKQKSNHWEILLLLLAILFLAFGLLSPGRDFVTQPIDLDAMQRRVEYLSSPPLEGRLTGSPGNRQTVEFLVAELEGLGLRGGGKQGSFEQPFRLLVPRLNSPAKFTIGSNSFELHQDYTYLTSTNGGGIDFEGELVVVPSGIFQAPRSLIEGRIVVVDFNRIQPDLIAYVQSLGGKGILSSAQQLRQSGSLAGRTGDSLFLGYLSPRAYRIIKALAEQSESPIIPQVELRVDLSFPVIETSNVVAVLDGRGKSDRVLLISANLDGLGAGPPGRVFGGALAEATGMAAGLELARVLSLQENPPFEKIVFLFWNGQHQELAGSTYYRSHPLFSLDKTTLIHLESVGLANQRGLVVQGNNYESAIFKDLVLLYAQDKGLVATESSLVGPLALGFGDEGVPVVTLSNADFNRYPYSTVDDVASRVDPATWENAVATALAYIDGHLYPSSWPDSLTLGPVLLGALVLWGLGRFAPRVVPYLVLVFLLALLVNIRPTTDVQTVQGRSITNFSLEITLKQTFLYLQDFWQPETFVGPGVGNLFAVARDSTGRSLALIMATLGLSLTLGFGLGLAESYRKNPPQLRSLGSLVMFSVPDVFLVLGLVFGYTLLYRSYPQVGNVPWLKGFVLPLIALSTIPAIYISRITLIGAREELGKDYIRAAKALGYSRFQIFTYHMFPGLWRKIIDALPTLLAVIFSNMIIVEYLFNYQGLAYLLLYLYKQQDANRFVPMALGLGALYALILWGFRRLRR